MKKTTRTVMAIIALALFLFFSVIVAVVLYNTSIINSTLFYIAIAAGVIGIAFYVVIMRDVRVQAERELAKMLENNVDESTEEEDTNKPTLEKNCSILEAEDGNGK